MAVQDASERIDLLQYSTSNKYVAPEEGYVFLRVSQSGEGGSVNIDNYTMLQVSNGGTASTAVFKGAELFATKTPDSASHVTATFVRARKKE